MPSASYRPDPRLLELPDGFFDPVEPGAFEDPRIRFRNDAWAARVGLHPGLDDEAWLRHFARFEPLPDNLPRPLCMRYHGHQFRAYNPRLGDGRGFTFAQLRDDRARLLDLGTKGSGITPYSRGGDGRLTLKGGVREILATEMLEALGVYTSKTFSVIETGESLWRSDEPSPTRSCVLVRLGHSHIRFGSFQRQADEGRSDRVRLLADHCIEHYVPELLDEPAPRRYVSLFAWTARRTTAMVADWMLAGFVHGVLNTDNMNICGESFDYGPWRFLPHYEPTFTAAYFDHAGLYAFGRQPESIAWNLQRLAEALDPVAPIEATMGLLSAEFGTWLQAEVIRSFHRRLGLVPGDPDDDATLIDDTYGFLARSRIDYAQFFFDWYGGAASRDRALHGPAAATYADASFERLWARLVDRAPDPAAERRLTDPYFAQPRPESMLVDEVERIWADIAERDDWQALHDKVARVRAMGRALSSDGESQPPVQPPR